MLRYGRLKQLHVRVQRPSSLMRVSSESLSTTLHRRKDTHGAQGKRTTLCVTIDVLLNQKLVLKRFEANESQK